MNLRLVMLVSLGLMLGGAGDVAAGTVTEEAAVDASAGPPFLGGFLKETRIIYPLRHDGWEAQGEHLYDTQELGASVRYVDRRHPDRWIDLYFYPAGMLTPEDFDRSIQHERDMLLAAAQPGASYRDMELGATQQFDYRSWRADGKKGEKSKGYSVDLQMILDDQLLHSAMTLQLDRMYYVKGRMSTSERDLSRPAIRRQLEKFVAGLSGDLGIVSTGTCWMPMPIEPMAQADKSAPGLFTMGTDGVERVLATKEKIFAADPASVEAQAAMMLAMSMTGRFVAGCEPVEQLNQPVKEGMRELRLEYHATDPDAEGQAPLLRPVRVGRG